MLCLLENTDPLHKVTIIPRGPYLGAAFHLPEEDKFHYYKAEGLEQLIVTMGGRVAEQITFGDVTSGASGDISQATKLARRMVCEWGMSEELGMIEYGSQSEHVFLARDMSGGGRDYSEDTAQKIDAAVKQLIDNSYKKAMDLILEHRDQLEMIAQGLLEFETLEGSHIRDIMKYGEMKDPPASPKPPETPEETPKAVEIEPDESKAGDEEDLPGDLAPAGA